MKEMGTEEEKCGNTEADRNLQQRASEERRPVPEAYRFRPVHSPPRRESGVIVWERIEAEAGYAPGMQVPIQSRPGSSVELGLPASQPPPFMPPTGVPGMRVGTETSNARTNPKQTRV